MQSSIPWSDNPHDYLRAYPSWYALYRTLSQERMTRGELAALVGASEEWLCERQGISKILHRDKTQYNLFDAIAVAFIYEFRAEPSKLEFWERMIRSYEDMLWQSLIGVVQGVDIYIAADFKKTLTLPYFDTGPHQGPDAGETAFKLNFYFQKILADVSWSDFSAEIGDDRHWAFRFAGRGYLMLNPLPLDADELVVEKSMRESKGVETRDEHGHKRLSIDNYMQVDPFFNNISWWSQEPDKRNDRLKERISEILEMQLHSAVPAEVRKMFDVLKGTIIYGFFYRPIFTVASDQIYFVADAAAFHRCKALGGIPPDNFGERIKLLKEKGVIPADEGALWDAARRIRNAIAHRTEQSMDMPASEVSTLSMMADDINRLFVPIFCEAKPN